MGAVLALLLFFTFFYQPAAAGLDTGAPAVLEESTPVPELDRELMALAADRTRAERLATEPEPFAHLLEKSLLVTPAVARKLQMPALPVPVASLRRQPDHYRGKYLWFKGQLEYLSPPQPGHPVPGYQAYEGRLRTSDGEPVLFAFSMPPPQGVGEGSWVRIEGYFLKLRDAHLPSPLDMAPMLVGPELLAAHADWEAVEQLDPAVLARVRDGRWNGHEFEGGEDMGALLVDSQDVPLWHLAGYAMRQDEKLAAADRRRVPAFTHEGQFEQLRTGELGKGTGLRILGTFVQARILPARVNPLGIESWSEVWVQVRELAGKAIPIWIPGPVEPTWKRHMPVTCLGYFFKRYSYTTTQGEVRWTPLFVSARLEPVELAGNALGNAMAMAFAGLVAVVASIFAVMAWRDRRQRERHETLLLERRRQRRARAASPAPAPGEQPCTS
jgi:hypothetical protein